VFGESSTPTDVVAYAGETPRLENQRGEAWSYCGVLMIPAPRLKDAYRLLVDTLEEHNAAPGDAPPSDIVFDELGGAEDPRTAVARDWLRHVALDDEKRFHLAMLGVHHDNLDRHVFGSNGSSRDPADYNRFFRAALANRIERCFDEDRLLQFKKVFRHASRSTGQKVFPWQDFWRRIERFPAVDDGPDEFHDLSLTAGHPDGHRIHSLFLQLLGVLLDATLRCLDDPDGRRGPIHAASGIWLDLVNRLAGEDTLQHPDTPYRHLHRLSLSFFPADRHFLVNDKRANFPDGLYDERDCLLQHRLSDQYSLF